MISKATADNVNHCAPDFYIKQLATLHKPYYR